MVLHKFHFNKAKHMSCTQRDKVNNFHQPSSKGRHKLRVHMKRCCSSVQAYIAYRYRFLNKIDNLLDNLNNLVLCDKFVLGIVSRHHQSAAGQASNPDRWLLIHNKCILKDKEHTFDCQLIKNLLHHILSDQIEHCIAQNQLMVFKYSHMPRFARHFTILQQKLCKILLGCLNH